LPFMARMRRSGVLLYRRRSGRRQPIIWAFDAISAPPGQRHHALLIAFEIAGSCTGVCEGREAPWVGIRRLRRCRLDFAKQRRSDQKKPWDWQMHRSLPEPDCSFRRSMILSQEPAKRAMPCAVNSRTRPASVDAGRSSRRPKVRRRRPRRAWLPINGRPNRSAQPPSDLHQVHRSQGGRYRH
jgi:hypothetical protein